MKSRWHWLRALFGLCNHDEAVIARRGPILGYRCLACYAWIPSVLGRSVFGRRYAMEKTLRRIRLTQ